MNLLTKSIIDIDLSHKGAGPCGAIKRLINMNIIYPKTGRQDQLKVKARVIVDRDNEGIDMGKPGLSSGVKSLAAIQSPSEIRQTASIIRGDDTLVILKNYGDI